MMMKAPFVTKPASYRPLSSDLKRVDAHVVQPEEYEELPELTDEMLARAVFKKAGRPRSGKLPHPATSASASISTR